MSDIHILILKKPNEQNTMEEDKMIVPKHYENMDILHENTMPGRCYYIPASKVMHTLVEKRELSDRFQLLNGQWKFKY